MTKGREPMKGYVDKKLVAEYDELSERIKYRERTSLLDEVVKSRVKHIDEMRQKPRRGEKH